MQKIGQLFRSLLVLSCGQAFAGGMANVLIKQPNFSGFWAGVGGSYLYSSLSG